MPIPASPIRRMSYTDLKGKTYPCEWDRENLQNAGIFPLITFGSKRSILLGRYSSKVAILGAWQTYRYCRVAKTRGGTRSVKTVWLNSWSLLFFDFSNFSLINFIFQVPTILVLFLLVINVSPFASRRNETFIDHRSNFGCHSSCNRNP